MSIDILPTEAKPAGIVACARGAVVGGKMASPTGGTGAPEDALMFRATLGSGNPSGTLASAPAPNIAGRDAGAMDACP